MKSLFIGFFLLVFATAAEDLQWDKTNFSYKAKLADKGVSFTFKVKNKSGNVITISKGKSSCACMTLQTKFPLALKAGEEKTINAHYDFTGKIGLNKGTIYITLPNKKLELGVEVDIPVPVTISPRFIIWKKGDRSDKEFKIL